MNQPKEPLPWQGLHQEFVEKLTEIEREQGDIIKRSEMAIKYCQKIVSSLNEAVKMHTFASNSEEIDFYKNIKPLFTAHLIYNLCVYEWEVKRPVGDVSIQVKYVKKKLRYLNDFFLNTEFIYTYLRSDSSYLDEELFIPKESEHPSTLLLHGLLDEYSFPSSVDTLLARIKASQMLQQYLNQLLQDLLKDPYKEKNMKLGLVWTESKTALIELAYSLHAAGTFNSGKADLKEIIETLEYIFQTNLGNYPRTFQEILARKTGYTNFIDKLREKLLLRIKTIEDKYMK